MEVHGVPLEVAAQATVRPSGEVSWPEVAAVDAVSALTASGRQVLGLDVRFVLASGACVEIPLLDASAADDADAALSAVLAALGGLHELATPDGTVERRVVVTWE